MEATFKSQMQIAQSLARVLTLRAHDPQRAVGMVSHCVKGELRHEELLVKVELRCELTWQVTGEPGPDLLSPPVPPPPPQATGPIPERARAPFPRRAPAGVPGGLGLQQ